MIINSVQLSTSNTLAVDTLSEAITSTQESLEANSYLQNDSVMQVLAKLLDVLLAALDDDADLAQDDTLRSELQAAVTEAESLVESLTADAALAEDDEFQAEVEDVVDDGQALVESVSDETQGSSEEPVELTVTEPEDDADTVTLADDDADSTDTVAFKAFYNAQLPFGLKLAGNWQMLTWMLELSILILAQAQAEAAAEADIDPS